MTKQAFQSTRSHLFTGTALALGSVLAAGVAHAEPYGILNGRSAAPPTDQISVEGALQVGDDVRYISARGNYAISPTMTAFANLGQASFDNSSYDGYQLGGGVFLHLVDQTFASSLDVALKPSVGYGRFSAGSLDADTITLAGEVLVSSPEPLGDTNVNWYANAGLGAIRTNADFESTDTNVDLIIGGGVTLPIGPGTVYAGIDYFDEVELGIGYRYGLR